MAEQVVFLDYPVVKRMMNLVIDSGRLMLENGGEVFRAQDTMLRMAESLGLYDFNVYTLTNGIFASAEGGTINEVRHIASVQIHLGRIEAVNAISRKMAAKEMTLEEAEAALKAAENMPEYGAKLMFLSGVMGAGAFGFLFGGGFLEVVFACICGAAEQVVTGFCAKHHIGRFFANVAATFVGAAVALLAHDFLFSGMNANAAIIGALMLLTPGISLTMGVRDIVNADYLSGMIRLLDAILVAASLACGVGLAWYIIPQLGVSG